MELKLEDVLNIIRTARNEYDEDYLDEECLVSVDYAEGYYDACNRIIKKLKSNYCE